MDSIDNKEHCPFCEILNGTSQTRIILENDSSFFMEDAFPVSTGHSLIIPKRHIASFFEATNKEKQDIFALLDAAKLVIERNYSPDGFNIGINDGPAAGQTVNHLHIHVIPRYAGDSDDPRGGVRWIFPEKADYWSKK